MSRARPTPALAALAALLFGGCGEELGPERMPATRVAGRARVGDRPIDAGWIEFIPVGGAVGTLRAASLGPDGRFEALGVAVGSNAIRIVQPPFPLPGARPPWVPSPFERFTTPLRRTFGPNPAEIDLDLAGDSADAPSPTPEAPTDGQ